VQGRNSERLNLGGQTNVAVLKVPRQYPLVLLIEERLTEGKALELYGGIFQNIQIKICACVATGRGPTGHTHRANCGITTDNRYISLLSPLCLCDWREGPSRCDIIEQEQQTNALCRVSCAFRSVS
jgi:hypothetical protein